MYVNAAANTQIQTAMNNTYTHSSHKCSVTTAVQLKLQEGSREIKTNFDKVDACVNTSAYKHNEHIHTVSHITQASCILGKGRRKIYYTFFIYKHTRFFYKKHEAQILTWVHGYLVKY